MFANQSPKRTNIEEANKHLQLLHQRVVDLEKLVEQRQEELDTRNTQIHHQLQRATVEKDAQIEELNKKVKILESMLHVSQITVRENEQTISVLESKAKKYDEICELSPMLANLLSLCDSKQSPTGSGLTNGTSKITQTTDVLVSATKRYARPCVDTSPTFKQMARQLSNSSSGQHFSISEDETFELPEDIFSKAKPEKELYL